MTDCEPVQTPLDQSGGSHALKVLPILRPASQTGLFGLGMKMVLSFNHDKQPTPSLCFMRGLIHRFNLHMISLPQEFKGRWAITS